MKRNSIKDLEIKLLLKDTLTDKINYWDIYIKGIDASYKYDGYNLYQTNKLYIKEYYLRSSRILQGFIKSSIKMQINFQEFISNTYSCHKL